MHEPLAVAASPREHGGVRLAEIVAALVEQAQKKDPDLTIGAIAALAKVNRVTLQNVVGAAKSGRPRSVDEETFWSVCDVLGVPSEAAIAPALRDVVVEWREARSLAATESRTPARQRRGQGKKGTGQ